MDPDAVKSTGADNAPGVPRKGTVHFVATNRGLFPLAELERFELRKKREAAKAEVKTKQAASKQLVADRLYMTEKGLVPYPFEVSGLLMLQDNCSYFDACVRQIAKDVTGQGYAIELRDDVDKGDEEVKKSILNFFLDPNTTEESLDDIQERLVMDWATIGWWCLEVARDDKAVTGLYHIPSHTVKVHRDGNKYCQIRQSQYVWFRRFGYEKHVNSKTGDESESAYAPAEEAHELIFYRNYYAQSSWYGAPNILPSVGPIKGLIGVRDYNLAFFENYGVPAALVTIEGDWEEDSVKQITDFLDVEIKGSNNAHKTLVLNPPEGGKVIWDPLITEVKEGHFKLYHKSLRDEVLVSYRMPPYRIGIVEIGSLGGSTAAEATRIYIDSIVGPLKKVLNHIFSQKIIRDSFHSEDWVFTLEELDIRDVVAEVGMYEKLFGMGVLNRIQIRDVLGWGEFDKEDLEEAKKYFIASTYREVGTEADVAMAEGADVAVAELRGKVDKVLQKIEKRGVLSRGLRGPGGRG